VLDCLSIESTFPWDEKGPLFNFKEFYDRYETQEYSALFGKVSSRLETTKASAAKLEF